MSNWIVVDARGDPDELPPFPGDDEEQVLTPADADQGGHRL
ncbi:MAG TPA: hypothetical protein VGX78_19590 [Pirellulales bacterium]|nr:hypothetical protein [Pirellulales bacterium]